MRGSNQESATPYCRCRVLYLGSSVPHVSKDGLLGCQEPLRELYPEQGAVGARGIDSWLSVWSNGLLLENVDENRKKVTRFFPIESLHYCAAVRHVKAGTSSDSSTARFLPLDSPFAKNPSANHPPLFAAILRRTTGIKVLECHAFICKRDMAANALVRCCFHAYADCRYVRNLEPTSSSSSSGLANGNANGVINGTSTPTNGGGSLYHTLGGSSTTLHENGNGTLLSNGNGSPVSMKLDTASNDDGSSLYNGDENHKVWARSRDDVDGLYQEQGTLRSTKGSRPRQLIAPPPPPPPPPQQPLMMEESNSSSASRKKAKNKLKKMKSKSIANGHIPDEAQGHHYVQQLPPHAVYANGHGHHTLGHPIRPQQIAMPYHPGHHQLPPSSSRSVAGTLARPAPVLLVPASTLPRKLHHPRIRPIPAAAPMVPMYAPMPVAVPAPPPPVLYQAGYGTTGNRGRRHHPHHQELMMANGGDGSTLGHQSRRMAASHADLSAMPGQEQQPRGSDSPDNDSRFGTGIYRRKGHLNERAFSYSIRAEHRSRSHGSLASLGFAGQNGTGPPTPKEDKKDREMAQMVAGLTLDHHPHENGVMLMKNGNGYHHHHHPHMPQPLPRPRR